MYLSWSSGRLVSILLLVLFLMSSCGKNRSKKKVERDERSISILEAKHSDIPLPVGFKLIDLDKNEFGKLRTFSTEFISCAGLLDRKKVIHYYLVNMERHGWEIVDLSNEREGLLFCSKPCKYCVISIRDNLSSRCAKGVRTFIYLFIKNKFREMKTEKNINAKDISGFGLKL